MQEDQIRDVLNAHWHASAIGDADAEHDIYADDAVCEYPQSGERIVGRINLQALRSHHPGKPSGFNVRRILGKGDLWITEYIITYQGRPIYTVSIMEFRDGKVMHETQYFADPFEAPDWRSQWVEEAPYQGEVKTVAKKTAKAKGPAGDWRDATLARMRALILEADPEMTEERKWKKASNPAGVPVWSHDGLVCTGETYKQSVKLTFARGASLADPSGLFNSSLEGNTRRAIDIHEGEEVDAGAFKALVLAAVAQNAKKA